MLSFQELCQQAEFLFKGASTGEHHGITAIEICRQSCRKRCKGILHHGDDIISLPLNVDEKMQVGTITHKDAVPTELGREFRRALEGYARRI